MYIDKPPDIKDLTFIFLVRQDNIERLENMLEITRHINSIFTTNIRILECSAFNNRLIENLIDKEAEYHFQYDPDQVLHRTKFLNQMIREVESPFVAIWDTDVIAPAEQIIKAIELLRNNEADFVYPYDKYFLDTSPILRRMYMKEGNIEVLLKNMKKMKEMYPPNPLGGAFLANLKAYKESGLENENFYGWGMEDGERYYRWENMGYRIKRVPGPLFHLSHPRGQNSTFHDTDQHFFKKKEVISVKRNKALKPDITAK